MSISWKADEVEITKENTWCEGDSKIKFQNWVII